MTGGDVLRYFFISAVTIVLLVVGLKLWGKQRVEKRVVSELRGLASPSSSFEQLYAADAARSLYQSMEALYRGTSKLGKEPGEILTEVFHGKGEAALFKDRGPGNDEQYIDPRETLIREGLLRNYQHCINLGVFTSAENLARLANGDPPEILSGPATGRTAEIGHVIDPSLSPGLEKLIPNMLIIPPADPKNAVRPTDIEITKAKAHATLLARAQLIERDAEERILKRYDEISQAAQAEPVQ